MRIAIFGAGAWGTALGYLLSAAGHQITWWSRRKELVDLINGSPQSLPIFPDLPFPESCNATTEIEELGSNVDFFIVAVSAQGCRSVLSLIKTIDSASPIILCAKGIESETGLFPHQIAHNFGIRADRLLTISGPGFAKEVARCAPTALVLASSNFSLCLDFINHFPIPSVRFYPSQDILGVEICAAAKNSLAIATGMADGLQLGMSARAALLTRGLTEMSRLVESMGAKRETVYGLAGVGDLILTATGDLSRNRRLGCLLALNVDLEEALKEIGQVAEGVAVSFALEKAAQACGIDLPIIKALCCVFRKEISPKDIVQRLMMRPSSFRQ